MVITLIVLLVLIAVAGMVILFYGLSLPDTQTFKRSFQVDATPEIIYDLARDAKNQSSWRSDIEKVSVSDDGKRWVEHTKQGDITFEVTHEDRPNSFSLRFSSNQGFNGEWVGTFTSKQTGTTVTLSEQVTVANPLLRALSGIMGFTEKFMRQYIADLKSVSEIKADIQKST